MLRSHTHGDCFPLTIKAHCFLSNSNFPSNPRCLNHLGNTVDMAFVQHSDKVPRELKQRKTELLPTTTAWNTVSVYSQVYHITFHWILWNTIPAVGKCSVPGRAVKTDMSDYGRGRCSYVHTSMVKKHIADCRSYITWFLHSWATVEVSSV